MTKKTQVRKAAVVSAAVVERITKSMKAQLKGAESQCEAIRTVAKDKKVRRVELVLVLTGPGFKMNAATVRTQTQIARAA